MAYATNGWCASIARRGESALILVDVINDLEFPGGEELLTHAEPMAYRVAALKRRARRMRIPAVYVNESTDRWKPSFARQVDRCLRENVRGRSIVEILRPERDDFFLLKTQQSACLSGHLDTLFNSLRVKTIILTGLSANICGLLATSEMCLADFRFLVPADCVASKSNEHLQSALRQVRTLGADTTPSAEIFFSP